MGAYNSAIITTAGQTLIANAISGGGTVTFSSMQASSYAYPQGTNISALTSLQDVQQTVQPFSAQVFNDTMIQVSARFDNSEVSESYLIQTIGIFAQLGEESPVLLAVVQATTPDQMPASSAVSPSAFIFNVQITVQQASSISVTVNAAGTATIQDILGIQENYVPNSKIDNNLLGTDPTHVLASPQGKYLHNLIQQVITEISQTGGLFGNFGQVIVNSEIDDPNSPEGSQFTLRGKGGNSGDVIFLDVYNNEVRILGKLGDSVDHVYVFRKDGIYLDDSKIC